jgi:hypothetical protein
VQALVRGEPPLHRDGRRRHPAAGHEHVGHEPRPQDDAVRERVAGRDPEAERIAVDLRRAAAEVGTELRQHRRAGEPAREDEEAAAVQVRGERVGGRHLSPSRG